MSSAEEVIDAGHSDLNSQDDSDILDRLIAKRLMDPHAKVHHLAMLTYRRYLTEYSRIKTESDAAIFVDKYGSERVNTPLYDPDDLVSKAQSFRVGQPLVALDHYHLEFINADSIPELYKFISAYQSSPVGTDPKIKNLIELSDDARNLALVIQMEQRQDADEHVHATAGAHKSATGKQMLAPSSKSVAAGGKPVQWFYVDFQAGPPLTCKRSLLTGDQEIAMMSRVSDPDGFTVKITYYNNAKINTMGGCIGDTCRTSINAESLEACASMLGHALDFYRQLHGN